MKKIETGLDYNGNFGWDIFCNAIEWVCIIGFWGGLILLFVVL